MNVITRAYCRKRPGLCRTGPESPPSSPPLSGDLGIKDKVWSQWDLAKALLRAIRDGRDFPESLIPAERHTREV